MGSLNEMVKTCPENMVLGVVACSVYTVNLKKNTLGKKKKKKSINNKWWRVCGKKGMLLHY